MAMAGMATKKGKEGTKGGKQIVEENANTLSFYRNMIFATLVSYLALMLVFSGEFAGWDIFFIVLAELVNGSSLYFMVFMARAKYSEAGGLVDSGVDLNMQSGLAEHVKDVIILTSGTLVLSFFSRYFWLLWLLVPFKACYYVWSKVIAPWVFAEAPEPTPQDEKKQRKMERRMRR